MASKKKNVDVIQQEVAAQLDRAKVEGVAAPARESSSSSSSVVVSRGLGGARWMALGVIFQKVAGVLVNNLIVLRLASAETLGVASIRLELVAATVLFLSREGFRLAMTRGKFGKRTELATAWVPAYVGVCLAFTASACCGQLFTDEEQLSFRLYCLAAGLEALSEPFHCLALSRVEGAPRAAPEPLAFLARDLCRGGLLVFFSFGEETSTNTLSCLAVAQVVYAVVLGLGRCGSWYVLVPRERRPSQLFPLSLRAAAAVDADAVTFALTAGGLQTIIKHCLTQADKAFLWSSVSKFDAGVYAKIESYGSVVVRVVLQPVEEASRLIFAKIQGDTKDDLEEAFSIFFKAAQYLGLIFAAVGAAYAPLGLRLLSLGRKKNSEEMVPLAMGLAAYCLFIPALALNGILEALVNAVGTKRQVAGLSFVHVASAAAFICFARIAVLDNLAAPKIVLAMAAAYVLRIIGVAFLVANVFSLKKEKKRFCFPRPSSAVLAAFALSCLATQYSRRYFEAHESLRQAAVHILLGGLVCLATAAVALHTDRPFLRAAAAFFRGRSTPKTD